MNKIEKYLKNIDKRQKYLIYFMIFGSILYLFAQIILPMRENQTLLQSQINELQVKLSNNSLKRLKKQKDSKKRVFMAIKEKKDKQKENIDYLISGLYKLKYVFYDGKEWAKSIDDILKYSLVGNLKIDYIKSKDIKDDSKNMLKKKKSLQISGSGKYVDIVAFISYIDNLNSLLQFQKTEIKISDKELKFNLLIDMFGIGL